MIKLPKYERDPKELAKLCKCKPVCKNRRRQWKGQIQQSSAELLLERKPIPDCHRRWPMKIYANSPCPLFAKSKQVTIKQLHIDPKPKHIVRICQAPIDDTVETPYLQYAELAKKLGAWDAVRACCAFCACGPCCPCGLREYILHDEERAARRRDDMRAFDKRVKDDYKTMRIMYGELM